MYWLNYVKIGLAWAIGIVISIVSSSHAQSLRSVLAQGDWLKIPVTKSGVYKIDRQMLEAAGWNVSQLNPQTVQLYGHGGKELSQAFVDLYQDKWQENAIEVVGEADGRLDHHDLILFYGQAPQEVVLKDSLLEVHTHLYTDTTFYYLTHSQALGKRIQSFDTTEGQIATNSVQIVSSYIDVYHHELNQTNLLESGRDWWGEYVAARPVGWQVKIADILPQSEASFTAQLMAGGIKSSTAQWTVNGELLGKHEMLSVPEGRYALKGRKSHGAFGFKANPINELLFFEVTLNTNNEATTQAYLDYFTLQVQRQLKIYDEQQTYRIYSGSSNQLRSYRFQGSIQQDGYLWEISKVHHPRKIVFEEGRMTTKPLNSDTPLQVLHGFSISNAMQPSYLESIENQNIVSLDTPDLLIITPPAFLSEAERLADFRRSHDHLDVEVVTTIQVYNEFSSGKVDVTALRNCIRHLAEKSSEKLKYVLLFGDATYDFKQYKKTSTQTHMMVPSYPSRESLDPLTTYVSDDYYGFISDDKGEWIESESGDYLLDLGVGRLPIKNKQEAQTIVDKLIHYAIGEDTKGIWKNKVVFVADDGDGDLHESHAYALSLLADRALHSTFMFNDAYQPVQKDGVRRLPQLNWDLQRALNEGASIINFSGHGDVFTWTQEQIFSLEEIQQAKGYNNLPLFITATCEFGRFDNPWVVSGAEQLVTSARGGGIGAITTTRPVYASSNFAMNQAFYKALGNDSLRNNRLGDLFKITKNASLKGSFNRNLTLLADPSMELNRGRQRIRWEQFPDTLRPSEEVILKGEVVAMDGEKVDESFNGIAYVEVYDQKSVYTTLGNDGSTGEYLQYSAKLYQGKVSVKQGRFRLKVQVTPQLIKGIGVGRVSVYAVATDLTTDASSQLPLYTNGVESHQHKEGNWRVDGYLDDPSFKNGDQVGQRPTLHLTIENQNPIRLSNKGIEAILNDSVKIDLSNYYWARLDTDQLGDLIYSFDELPLGEHRMIIILTDVYNNVYERTFTFRVNQEEGIQIQEAIVYPNPFDSEISYQIRHTKPGDDLLVTFTIYNQEGAVLFSEKRNYINSKELLNERFEPFVTQKIHPAYLFEIVVESLSDHSKSRRSGWLLHKL